MIPQTIDRLSQQYPQLAGNPRWENFTRKNALGGLLEALQLGSNYQESPGMSVYSQNQGRGGNALDLLQTAFQRAAPYIGGGQGQGQEGAGGYYKPSDLFYRDMDRLSQTSPGSHYTNFLQSILDPGRT